MTDAELLALRRDYHRATTQASMSTHHLEFLKKCEEASLVPPGLRIRLRPQVYASNASAVEANIAHIVETAQREIVKELCTHYSTILSK